MSPRRRSRPPNRWWAIARSEPERVAGALEAEIKRLWDADAWRREETERNTRRFGVWMSGLFPDGSVSPRARQREDLRINIVKSAVETIAARVGSNRPRPRVLTTEGDHTLKVQAKKLQALGLAVESVEDCGLVWVAVDMRVLLGSKTARSLARMSRRYKVTLPSPKALPTPLPH